MPRKLAQSILNQIIRLLRESQVTYAYLVKRELFPSAYQSPRAIVIKNNGDWYCSVAPLVTLAVESDKPKLLYTGHDRAKLHKRFDASNSQCYRLFNGAWYKDTD